MKPIALLAAVFAAPAFAINGVTIDVGAGEARATAAPDGQFWQKENHNSLRMKDNVQAIGISFQLNPMWSVGAHTANLGTYEIHAQAVTCPGDDCTKADRTKDPSRPECKGKFSDDSCRYSWVSNGGARGFTLDTAITPWDWHGLKPQVRGALYVHRVYWRAVVENTDCRDAGCWRYAFNQKSYYQIRPVLGLGVEYAPAWAKGGSLVLSVDRFFDIAKHNEVTAGFKGDIDRTMIWVKLPTP